MVDDLAFYLKSIEEVEKNFATDIKEGLSQNEATQRLGHYGRNQIEQKSRISPWNIFIRQFKNIIVLLLLAASIISFSLGDIIEGI